MPQRGHPSSQGPLGSTLKLHIHSRAKFLPQFGDWLFMLFTNPLATSPLHFFRENYYNYQELNIYLIFYLYLCAQIHCYVS